MGSGKRVTVGYRYYMGLHMGLNRGECDEIVEIKVGDRTAWSGSITNTGLTFIDRPNLFGGDEREGGIVGRLWVLMGDATQEPPSALVSMLGGSLVPAFRGITSLFYDGQYSALNPYPKPWAVRRRRILKGWDGEPWYPEKARIELQNGAIHAMNPAHIIYQCYTDRSWGRGWPRTSINDAQMRAAADRLYDEGFGLCLEWTRQDRISSFMQVILDHIGGALTIDRATGQRGLVLIRGDYDIEELPLYTPDSGLLGIDDDQNAATGANEIIVRYRNPIDGEEGQVRVQNGAAIRAHGGAKLTTTKDYPGLPTAELALRVAQRDLLAESGLLKRFRVRLDRRAWNQRPASVFRISAPEQGILNMVLRVGRVERGEGGDGTIVITAVQDRFALPATAYIEHQGSEWTPPSLAPVPITARRPVEATWRDLVRALDPADLQLVNPTASFLSTFALRPQGTALSYDIFTRVGTSGPFVERATGTFTPSGTLASELLPGDTAAVVEDGVDLELVEAGSAAMIGDEIVRIDSIDHETGEITLGRGCVDTVPARHSAGTRVWFFDDLSGDDPTEYTTGNTVQSRLLTVTGTGRLELESAPIDSLLMSQRQNRPYPPGRLRINGQENPTQVVGTLQVAWSHRDRLLQADQLVDTSEGDIGPEDGVTYTVRVYINDVLEETVDEIVGNTAPPLQLTSTGLARVEVESVRDELTSWQALSAEFDYISDVVSVVAVSPTVYAISTSHNVEIPEAAEVGDLLLAVAMHRDTLTAPPGWTLVASAACSNPDVPEQRTSVYKRIAQLGDGGSNTTWMQATSQRISVHMLCLRHPDGCDVLDFATASQNSQQTNILNWAEVQATKDGQLGIACASTIVALSAGTTTITPSSGVLTTPSSAVHNRLAVAYLVLEEDQVMSGMFTSSAGVVMNGVASVSVIVGP